MKRKAKFEVGDRAVKILLALLFCVAPAFSQTIAPLETVKVHVTCGKLRPECQADWHVGPTEKWWTPLPVRQDTADRAWFESVGASVLLNVGDVENSLYALNRAPIGGRPVEFNAIFGLHPNRRTYYATTLPVTAGLAWLSWHYKRQDDAMRAAGWQRNRYIKWWVPNALNTAGHAVSIIWTAFGTHR